MLCGGNLEKNTKLADLDEDKLRPFHLQRVNFGVESHSQLQNETGISLVCFFFSRAARKNTHTKAYSCSSAQITAHNYAGVSDECYNEFDSGPVDRFIFLWGHKCPMLWRWVYTRKKITLERTKKYLSEKVGEKRHFWWQFQVSSSSLVSNLHSSILTGVVHHTKENWNISSHSSRQICRMCGHIEMR